MNEKQDTSQKLESFFAGKGFYIVLFLCMAVIGLSAWVMLSGIGTDVEPAAGDDMTVMRPENALPVLTPAPTAAVSAAPNPDAAAESATPDSPPPETEVLPEAPEVAETITEPETPVMDEAEAQAAAVWSETADYFIWPCIGPVEVPHTVTTLRYDRTMADWRTHDGVDIAAGLGEHVMASASGRVSAVYTDPMYGVTVEIDHGGGLVSVYSNLAELPTVVEGDGVMVGEIIGSVGDTALCESAEVCHLHFAMRQDGQSIDPTERLPAR